MANRRRKEGPQRSRRRSANIPKELIAAAQQVAEDAQAVADDAQRVANRARWVARAMTRWGALSRRERLEIFDEVYSDFVAPAPKAPNGWRKSSPLVRNVAVRPIRSRETA